MVQHILRWAGMTMPHRLSLDQIEELIARDEAQLATYRLEKVDGPEPDKARELGQLVEQRLALLRQTREARAADPGAD